MRRPNGSALLVPTFLVAASMALALAGCASSTPTATVGTRASATAAAPNAPKSPVPGVATDQQSLGTGGSGAPEAAPASTPVPDASKLVIVDKTIKVEATDVTKALDKIRALALASGADIVTMQVATSSDQPVYAPAASPDAAASDSSQQGGPLRAYVTVRVPGGRYQSFVAEAAKLGRVLFQSESSQDVTQQHVDLTARLANENAELARLRQMFSKARNVSEMLQVEHELARVQGDAESLKAQIDYLERQAAMATVTIELAEPNPIVAPAGTDWGVATALTTSIRAFVATFNGILVILGPLLALLIFIGLPVFLVVVAVRRMLRRRRVVASAPSQAPESAKAGE